MLFRPEEQPSSLDEYFGRFWAVLQFLHDGETEPWPATTPLDPEELWWEFSFGGTEIFVVCNTPAHRSRRSRHNRSFMITFQLRWVFEGLEADTPRGAKARQVIRNRIRRFDGMEPAVDLGNHGPEGNREWRQYFLPDTADDKTASCPFLARPDAREQPAAALSDSALSDLALSEVTIPWAAETAGSLVLVNDDGHFSLRPAAVPVPDHWRETGVSGAQETCLQHVAQMWTDMRPATSPRRRLNRVA
ncbi:MAG: uncharacterized protein QOF98_3193 [Streptomyces sp.]|nr:uncharacterized protein [Streptomyces sp.]